MDNENVERIQFVEEDGDGKRRKKKQPLQESLISWAKTIIIALVLALLIKNFVIVNAAVVSGSMEETIMTGDRVICSRLHYYVGDPQRFDVIAFDYGEGGDTVVYVKRVIGLPGETIEVADGKVYIDGSTTPLPDNFVSEVPQGDFGPYDIPEGEYFVMGDNRNHSYDSTMWPYPSIQRDVILGKALFCYYPEIKGIKGPEQ